MDKAIRHIERGVKRTGKELKSLEQMDKKQDKIVDAHKKMMKKEKVIVIGIILLSMELVILIVALS